MDRVIYNTAVLCMGTLEERVIQALAGLDVLVLSETEPDCTITRVIRYAAGNLAGVFGNRPDGLKLIVNAHTLIMGPDSIQALEAALAEAGTDIPGLYIADEGFDPSDAAAYTRQRLEHFARAGEMMNRPRQMHVGGEYTLDILRPKLKTLHRLNIQNDNGSFSGIHTTENDAQPMQKLAFDGRYLTWLAYSGTTSSELFAYRLEVFDDIMLGATWRVDGESEAPFRSPVLVERIRTDR